MANLYVTATYDRYGSADYLPVPDGSTVEAWAVTKFVVPPSGFHRPPSGSPDGTATTSNAAAVLTVASLAVNYHIRVVLAMGAQFWFEYTQGDGQASGTPLKCRFPYPGRFFGRG